MNVSTHLAWAVLEHDEYTLAAQRCLDGCRGGKLFALTEFAGLDAEFTSVSLLLNAVIKIFLRRHDCVWMDKVGWMDSQATNDGMEDQWTEEGQAGQDELRRPQPQNREAHHPKALHYT